MQTRIELSAHQTSIIARLRFTGQITNTKQHNQHRPPLYWGEGECLVKPSGGKHNPWVLKVLKIPNHKRTSWSWGYIFRMNLWGVVFE